MDRRGLGKMAKYGTINTNPVLTRHGSGEQDQHSSIGRVLLMFCLRLVPKDVYVGSIYYSGIKPSIPLDNT